MIHAMQTHPSAEPQSKVLLAEDEPGLRRLLGKVLRDAGYDVVEAPDGAALWHEIVNWQDDDDDPREPDLIISDIHTPGWTGLEVLRRFRSFNWSTPVILMSAFTDLPSYQEALLLGATHVFNKPFDVHQLLLAIRRVLGDPA
jgi:DNA-binding response OmpR family regulator